MELLELSVELVEIVVGEMIAAIGLLKALKLRLVCKLFDELVINDLLDGSRSRRKASSILHRHPFFVKFLKRKLDCDTSKTSHLSFVLNQSIDKMLCLQPKRLPEQRPMLMSNLIESVAAVLPMDTAVDYMQPQFPNHALVSKDVVLHGAMVLAASFDDTQTMEALVREAGGFPPHSAYFVRIFTAAARTGAYNTAVYLLEHGYDHKKYAKQDWTRHRRVEQMSAIFAAAYGGHKEIINLMFERKFDMESEWWAKHSAQQAIRAVFRGGHFTLVNHIWKVLLHGSCDWGRCVLYYAASTGALNIVQNLLAAGVDPCASFPGVDGSVIEGAASRGKIEVVEYLLKVLGGDSKAKHDSLITASRYGHTDVVKFLLDHEADVNASRPQREPRTPLIAAVEGHWEDTVQLLLERGADISLLDSGCRGLWLACRYNLCRLARMFIEAGVDSIVRGQKPRSDQYRGVFIPPILRAAIFGHQELVQVLLESGIVLPDLSANAAYQAYADEINKYRLTELKTNIHGTMK